MKKNKVLLVATAATLAAVLAGGLIAYERHNRKPEEQTEEVTTETVTEEKTTKDETTQEITTEEKSTTEKTTKNSTEDTTEDTKEKTTTEKETATEPVVVETTTIKEDSGDGKETDWSGQYQSLEDAGSRQLHITKSGGGYAVSGEGVQGDKFCEISGKLTKVSASEYTMRAGNATLTFTMNNGILSVRQSGSIDGTSFTFKGRFQMSAKTEGIG